MKITKSQLKHIIKEELNKIKETDSGIGIDKWVNPAEGMTNDEIYDKVSKAINQIRELLEEHHELAQYSPDNLNKGEGAAMADLVRFIDSMYEQYGSGDPWK
jgi:hypothetical protein